MSIELVVLKEVDFDGVWLISYKHAHVDNWFGRCIDNPIIATCIESNVIIKSFVTYLSYQVVLEVAFQVGAFQEVAYPYPSYQVACQVEASALW